MDRNKVSYNLWDHTVEVERKVAKVSFIAVDDKLKGNLRKQNKKWEKIHRLKEIETLGLMWNQRNQGRLETRNSLIGISFQSALMQSCD